MNGPVTMYKVKPAFQLPNGLDISTSMYKMKNIHGSNFISSAESQDKLPNIMEQIPLPEVVSLESRQEAILQQLLLLKDQMAALRSELNRYCCPPKKVAFRPNLQENGVVRDIVVNANPENPPYSLLLINKLWPESLNLNVNCYTHSSVKERPTNLGYFENIQAENPDAVELKVTLVWKNVSSDCEFIVSPLNQCGIRGEVNLLRFLHRCMQPKNDIIEETKLDTILDTCHRLTHSRTVREKQAMIRSLNAALGKSDWLGGEAMNVADIAAWSAVSNCKDMELTKNMSKWMVRCSVAAGLCKAN